MPDVCDATTTRAVVVLAAGASRRFGAADKLLADFQGRPLVTHAFALARDIPAAHHIAVVSSDAVADLALCSGMQVARTTAGAPQSASLKAGIAEVATVVTEVVVLLGDMPLLTQADVDALLSGPAPACVVLNGRPMVPARFPQDWFADLAALDGDQGARGLLRRVPLGARVAVPADHLRDVDTLADLAALTAPAKP